MIGAGYVGLAAAIQATRAGFSVTALDLDADKVRMLMGGQSYIDDISDQEVRDAVTAGRLTATTEADAIATADVILICVPTPLTPHRVPDLTAVRAAVSEVAAHLHPGQLISLESTTYPGTTEDELLPALSHSGLKVGRDFFLVFCPERIDPGNKEYRLPNTARVLGGVTPECLEVGAAFYQYLSPRLFTVSSPRTAEMTKLFENIYRAVNIALVNEMALLCDRMGLDVWEVVRASASKPFGIQAFRPGPGVGGHCIPLDPHYLAWKAKEYDFTLRFVELAGEINSAMPYFVVSKLGRLLNKQNRPLQGARILLLGVAYKRDVADTRESPALRIIQQLRQAGAEVLYHDPLVPILTPHAPGWNEVLNSVSLTPDLLCSLDAAVVVTDHSSIDFDTVAMQVPLLLDTRGVVHAEGRSESRVVRL